MTKAFGTAPPPGALTLNNAHLLLPITKLQEALAEGRGDRDNSGQSMSAEDAQAAGISGKISPPQAWLEAARQSATTKALQDGTHKCLLSGELRAVAIELGAIGAEYLEVLPIHWSLLQIDDWERSLVRRYNYSPSPIFYVLVYTQDNYEKIIESKFKISHETREATESSGAAQRRKTLKETIRVIARSATPEIKEGCNTKADFARWVCGQIPGRKADDYGTRYVKNVLEKELADWFPDAPDGKKEK